MKMRCVGFIVALAWLMLTTACNKPGSSGGGGPVDTTVIPPPATFDINSITDTYDAVAPFTYYSKWGWYNVHDPSIKKFGDASNT